MAVCAVFLSACAHPHAATEVDLSRSRIVRARTGQEVSLGRFVRELLRARVVYVGESHDDPRDHRVEAVILRALAERAPSLALGMEMFQRPFQPALDDWIAGRIGERTLRERTEWKKRWGFDLGLYRPLLELARTHHVPVIALNTPSEITHVVAHQGIDALDPCQRASLPQLDLGNVPHRALVMKPLERHGHLDRAALERFYTAQVLWDETMAETVARRLARPDGPERVVVFAGRMHVLRPAIPVRGAKRGAQPYAIVQPMPAAEVKARKDWARVADWLWLF